MPTPTHTIKVGDTAPPISALLKGADNTAQDLTGATVAFNMKSATAVIIDHGACIINDAVTGDVSFHPPAPQAWAVGSYDAEFEVTHADGTITTFPSDSNFKVKVVAAVA